MKSYLFALALALGLLLKHVMKKHVLKIPLMALLLLLLVGSLAHAQDSDSDSFLFGNGPRDAFGSPGRFHSISYPGELRDIDVQGFNELPASFGDDRPTELRILIKDDYVRDGFKIDIVKTPFAKRFVQTLVEEKANLMSLYRMSNSEYNRLAALAFGIMGRESRFGFSVKYVLKEHAQFAVTRLKQLKACSATVGENSRGLTQIKVIPEKISRFYCVRSDDELRDARIAAVSTLAFLAESLELTKFRVRELKLTYINAQNIFDYVLYVYFGGMSQLVRPQYNTTEETLRVVDEKAHTRRAMMCLTTVQVPEVFRFIYPGGQINRTATPSRNLYVQTVKRNIESLALFENERVRLQAPRNNACRVR